MLLRACLGFALFWGVIHLLHNTSKSKNRPILPLSRSHRQPALRVTLRPFRLKVETLNLNEVHSRYSNRAPRAWYYKYARQFYDIGIFIGCLGMIVTLGAVVWTVYSYVFLGAPAVRSLRKRGLSDVSGKQSDIFNPIVCT
jgi:hypothetical protein